MKAEISYAIHCILLSVVNIPISGYRFYMTQQQPIETFYTAFQQRDYAGMIACYHDDIRFIGFPVSAMFHPSGRLNGRNLPSIQCLH